MSEAYSYPFPRPAVTVDAALFWPHDGRLSILLIQRGHEPFPGAWALPGGFVEIDEELDEAIARELAEETGVAGVRLSQFGAFGTLGRDPRTRTVSVAYIGVIDGGKLAVEAGDDAAAARWFDVEDLPELAFDHGAIAARARRHLRESLRHLGVGAQVMPDAFTLDALRAVYDTLAGRPFDPAAFDREMVNLGVLDVSETGAGRRLYRFNPARVAPF